MHNRRSFLESFGKGAAVSSIVALSSNNIFSSKLFFKSVQNLKEMKIGIIGAENSHTKGFGKLFNIDKKFPGVELKYVWGETEELAKIAMKEGGIPNMVKDSKDMLGKIDALIVDHRHGKFHLEAAMPYIEAGIPTFIDKPFCYRLEEGKKFLALAKKLGTPVTSFSSIAQSDDTFDIKEQVSKMGQINQVVRYGPLDLNSKYGGVFFYGSHLIQPLMNIFGDDIVKVRIGQNGVNSNAGLVFKNGMLATLVFTTKKYGWQTFVENNDGIVELKSSLKKADPYRYVADMVEMFRTRIEPKSHESILKEVAVLEALERSVSSDQWESVML
jgi:predicted dehydrogenase